MTSRASSRSRIADSSDGRAVESAIQVVVVGIGARRGATIGDVRAAITESLLAAEVEADAVAAIVTVDAKPANPALLGLAELLGVPLHPLPRELLAQQPVPNPSAVAQRLIGTPSVAEAAVLAFGAELLLPKRVYAGVTVAVGRLSTDPAADPETTHPETTDPETTDPETTSPNTDPAHHEPVGAHI
jgi:cobalamin biosynthesis protein CbiG